MPAGQKMMRQKLASVLLGSPSFSLSRMNGFSPVTMTRLGSATLIDQSSRLAGESASFRCNVSKSKKAELSGQHGLLQVLKLPAGLMARNRFQGRINNVRSFAR